MAQIAGSLMKIEHVLDIARRYPKFYADLKNDPEGALRIGGFDLSHGEAMAIVDLVKETQVSKLTDRMAKARDLWGQIESEHE